LTERIVERSKNWIKKSNNAKLEMCCMTEERKERAIEDNVYERWLRKAKRKRREGMQPKKRPRASERECV